MPIDRVINILVTVTLIEMIATIGLGVTFADVIGVARNWRLVGRAALANYVCVPAVVVGLLVLFGAAPLVAAGFLIVAVCPGAPYGPPFTALARGDVARSVGLMVILAASSAFVAPVLLLRLLPLMAGDQPLRVDAARIVTTLLVTQLLPPAPAEKQLLGGTGLKQRLLERSTGVRRPPLPERNWLVRVVSDGATLSNRTERRSPSAPE